MVVAASPWLMLTGMKFILKICSVRVFLLTTALNKARYIFTYIHSGGRYLEVPVQFTKKKIRTQLKDYYVIINDNK